ncbi:helix-turn-helix domain-containing protein [Primorskyibacter sp. S187A]|uniref:helix-turn-helix domain-containing protein n=1 Tax=Primorskyibacter sp. S187A TaxID=3415130 RepID=UPI003C7B1D8A
MDHHTDKRIRAQAFRDRLAKAMDDAALSQAALARAIHVDRSTISQLLSGDGARLPNAQVVAEAARACGVSSDWLLSLSDRAEQIAQVFDSDMSVTAAPRTLVDEQIFAWHQEAKGYKIRHVPAGLPDMLKIEDLMLWEYTPHLGRTARQAIGASQDRLSWMRQSGSDYEIAVSQHEIESFARGEGYYTGLDPQIRRTQLDHLIALADHLYPRLRLSFFDARALYSAPVTIFGPLLAVIYLGANYLAFRDTQRVQVITAHFDTLIREARIPPRAVPERLARLKEGIT